jgi:tRNA (adenine37-N6)-methyltransferase
MSHTYVVEPIARVLGGREDVRDDAWGTERAVIRLHATFEPEAFAGLADFSHIEVVYVFDRVPDDEIETGARHPRGNLDWPLVGIFAQRAKDRPNRLAVSRCTLLRVDGRDLHVQGLDAVAGTPILDIKPWMDEFGPTGATHQPAWSRELMRGYW